MGALIGKQNGRNIEIMNSFELAFDIVCEAIVINKDYYSLKEGQCKIFYFLFLFLYMDGDLVWLSE